MAFAGGAARVELRWLSNGSSRALGGRVARRVKPLLDTLPPGFVVDTPWLIARGIDPKSIHDYVTRGWLERLVRGVYRRPARHGAHGGGEFWAVLLLSLQRLMNYAVHLGGESALDLAGYSHS